LWPWSSYPAALGLAARPDWLRIDWTLAQFAPDVETARGRLERFVAEGLLLDIERRGGMPTEGIYFGSEPFVAAKTANLTPIPEIPRAHWQPLRPPLDELLCTSENPIPAAYRDYGYTLKEIADELGCHYSTVSRRLRQSETA
jgi:AraC-like DNA-binding protein